MSPAVWVSLIGALAALVGALAALVSAWRGHLVINKQVKPTAQANTDAVLRLAEDAPAHTQADVKGIINGAARDG